MADGKYYYIRLKENFFDDEAIKILESMPDGYLYSNILLKMYLASLKTDGRLMLNNIIPYNAQMIASITRHQVGTVEKALDIFKQIGLIDVLDNGAIYMMNIQNFIGKASTEADRQREYDRKIASERNFVRNLGENCKKSPGEIETKKDIEIETEIKPKKKTPSAAFEVILSSSGLTDDVKDALRDFAEARKQMRAPLTDKAAKLLIGKLIKMSDRTEERIAIINQSIENGWKGFYPIKTEKARSGSNKAAEELDDFYKMASDWVKEKEAEGDT